MNKQHTLFFCLLLVPSISNSQTYSTIIPDRVIEEIMDCEIHHMISSLDGHKFTPGKIDKEIVDWRELTDLNIDSLHLIKDVLPQETEDTLKSIPELFAEKDFKYMARQVSQDAGSRWKLPRSNIKFVNNCKMGCARFSIPLFNENHTKAIIYEEEIYNPIAACGLIKVYILEDHTWKQYKSMGIWLQ